LAILKLDAGLRTIKSATINEKEFGFGLHRNARTPIIGPRTVQQLTRSVRALP